MPLYRFAVHEGYHAIDPETVDLPDIASARREGIRRAGAMLVLDAYKLEAGNDWRLDATDENDTLLYRFDFVMTIEPAVRR